MGDWCLYLSILDTQSSPKGIRDLNETILTVVWQLEGDHIQSAVLPRYLAGERRRQGDISTTFSRYLQLKKHREK